LANGPKGEEPNNKQEQTNHEEEQGEQIRVPEEREVLPNRIP